MPKKEATQPITMRVLRIGASSSLSGKSQLTYHIGCNAEGDIALKVVANSGSGQFNADWIPLSVIEKLLSGHPADKPFSSRVLQPAYSGKSTNSPAFLFATLLAEGLVTAGKEKDSGYLLGDIEAFKQAMSVLIASGTNLKLTSDSAPNRKRGKENE